MEKSDSRLHNHFALALKVAHSHLWMDYVTSNTVFNKKKKRKKEIISPSLFCFASY